MRRLGILLALAAVAAACRTPVGVHRMDPRAVHRALTANVLSTDRASTPTRNVLYERDLIERFEDDPEGALAALHALVVEGRSRPDDVFALAELSFLHGGRSGERKYDLAAALYAWAYLFPERSEERPSPFDPRFRLACDLYNQALASGFASEDRSEVELRAGAYWLPFGVLEVDMDPEALRWGNRVLYAFKPVAEYDVRGLGTRYRRSGLGAPLAAATKTVGEAKEPWSLVAPRLRVPVTALLRIDRAGEQLRTEYVRATLDVHPAGEDGTTTIDGEPVPLELEWTASLAAMLAESPAWKRELRGFLESVGAREKVPHLVALRPYRPGLIPVVLVHGTASSAARWAQMLNVLATEPRFVGRYQAWFFSYDTGNPIAYSAMLLREALTDAVQRLDPTGQDAALRRMVVIGHSQGGLLTKMTAIESGSRFWDNVSSKPLDSLSLSEDSRDLLRRALFVHPLPFVRRVVFIATPHHGSYVAGSWAAQQVARFVKLPLRVAHLGNDLLLGRNRAALRLAGLSRLPTSVDNMTPGNPFLETLVSLPVAPGVAAHSIIAVKGDGPVEDQDDGVVEYRSAHVEGVESELIVRSGHSCQANPHTIEEVRRILLLNLDEE